MAGLRKYLSLYSSTSNSFGTGEAVTITPNSVVGLPTGNLVLTFDRVDSSGTATPSKMERIKGSVSGGNFVVASGGRGYDGTTEQAHTSPIVEMIFNATDWNDVIDALTNLVSVTTGAVDTTKVADLTTAQTFTNKTLTTPVVASFYQDAGKTKLMTTPDTASDTITANAATQTLTNKRITKRVTSLASSATPTINTDNCDVVDITALAAAINTMSTNLSGTPTNKQTLVFEIKDDGSPRAIAWGTSFVAGGVALPTTTVASKILTVGFMYSTANSLNKWRCIASAQEA